MSGDERSTRDALAHVLWIGGPPDSGKTSIAALLAEQHQAQVYHFDRHEMAHIRRADPVCHPAIVAFRDQFDQLDERAFANQLWLAHPPATMANLVLASWTQRAALAVEDLLALPTTAPIIAEGPGFFPEVIAPYLADSRQGIWLVPSEGFKRGSVARRNKLATVPVRDLVQARENLIRRDLLLGQHFRREAAALGLTVQTIDGSQSLAEVAALVEAQFAPWLRGRVVSRES